jgi:hypothetical protein
MNNDEQNTVASDPDAPIPVLVLRMPALLPCQTMTVRCGRPVGLKLLAHVVAASLHELVVVGQRDPRVEEPDESDLFVLGCRARVVSVDLSASQLVVVGVSRARMATVVSREPCFLASVVDVPEPEASPRAAAIAQQILAVCERAAAAGDITPALLDSIRRATPGTRADIVAAFAEVKSQRWLEAVDVEQRCLLAFEAVQAAFPAASPAAPTHGIALLAQVLTTQEHVRRRVSDDVEAAALALHRVLDGRAPDHFDELVRLLIDAEERGAKQRFRLPVGRCWPMPLTPSNARRWRCTWPAKQQAGHDSTRRMCWRRWWCSSIALRRRGSRTKKRSPRCCSVFVIVSRRTSIDRCCRRRPAPSSLPRSRPSTVVLRPCLRRTTTTNTS